MIHLYEQFRLSDHEIAIPGYQYGVIYDNTWIINVVPPGRAGKPDRPARKK